MKRGFTLLEVMVSLGILAISLTAIAGISAGNYAASEYARGVTIATLLARSKMIDVEEELWKDGFGDDEKELDGDFDKEGFEDFKWTATARKIEVDVSQLVGSLIGGDVNPENLTDRVQDFLGAMTGGLGTETESQAQEQVAGSDLMKMLGGEGLEMMFKSAGQTLADSIREITLEISWGPKGQEESIKFVQYITTTGRINVPSANQIRLDNPAPPNQEVLDLGAGGGQVQVPKAGLAK